MQHNSYFHTIFYSYTYRELSKRFAIFLTTEIFTYHITCTVVQQNIVSP